MITHYSHTHHSPNIAWNLFEKRKKGNAIQNWLAIISISILYFNHLLRSSQFYVVHFRFFVLFSFPLFLSSFPSLWLFVCTVFHEQLTMFLYLICSVFFLFKKIITNCSCFVVEQRNLDKVSTWMDVRAHSNLLKSFPLSAESSSSYSFSFYVAVTISYYRI